MLSRHVVPFARRSVGRCHPYFRHHYRVGLGEFGTRSHVRADRRRRKSGRVRVDEDEQIVSARRCLARPEVPSVRASHYAGLLIDLRGCGSPVAGLPAKRCASRLSPNGRRATHDFAPDRHVPSELRGALLEVDFEPRLIGMGLAVRQLFLPGDVAVSRRNRNVGRYASCPASAWIWLATDAGTVVGRTGAGIFVVGVFAFGAAAFFFGVAVTIPMIASTTMTAATICAQRPSRYVRRGCRYHLQNARMFTRRYSSVRTPSSSRQASSGRWRAIDSGPSQEPARYRTERRLSQGVRAHGRVRRHLHGRPRTRRTESHPEVGPADSREARRRPCGPAPPTRVVRERTRRPGVLRPNRPCEDGHRFA